MWCLCHPKVKTLAVFKSAAEISLVSMLTSTLGRWCKIFLSLVSSMLARALISQLKENGLKNQQLQMQESELSDWNGASVCTNPFMDYWLNWAEGVPDSFLLTLISLSVYCTVWGGATWSYCVLRRFPLQYKPWLTVSIVCLLLLQSVS